MSQVVTVVDYGIGNLYSVARAVEACGAAVDWADSRAGIERAQRLILPGVGAFANGMRELEARHLVNPIRAFAASGRPLLGICLGMQLLLSGSEEFGSHAGLDLVAGTVVAVAPVREDGTLRRIPHIGWNELLMPATRMTWSDTVLADVPTESSMYFVHSYSAQPADSKVRLADCSYEGALISAAIQVGNISGCQFHPEKSGRIGLSIIKRFAGVPALV